MTECCKKKNRMEMKDRLDCLIQIRLLDTCTHIHKLNGVFFVATGAKKATAEDLHAEAAAAYFAGDHDSVN